MTPRVVIAITPSYAYTINYLKSLHVLRIDPIPMGTIQCNNIGGKSSAIHNHSWYFNRDITNTRVPFTHFVKCSYYNK